MKFRARYVAFFLLAVAYLAAAFLVLRRKVDEARTDRVTIRISQWQLEGGVREAITAIIRRYEELNPRVHVVQIDVPGNVYLPWIQTQMVGGTGPDIVEYSWPWPDTARNFQPITAEVMQPNPYNRGTPLEGVPWRDTFIDGMTSPDNYVQTLSQYYSVSMSTGIYRIVYNRDLVKKITGQETAPRNYREFLALCDEIKAYAKAHALKLAPLANSRTTHILMSGEIVGDMTGRLAQKVDFLHRLKLEPLDLAVSYVRGEWSYDSPELAAAFEVLGEYGSVCTPGFIQLERESALTDFVSGRAAMIMAPSWESSSLLQICPFALGAFRFPAPREDDPVYGKFPKGPFSEGQVITGMPFYLNRNTAHRAEAIDFMRFLGSYEGSTIWTRISSWLPIVIGVKPSDFSAQFAIQTEGYNWYGGFLGPSNHIDCQNFWLSELYTLWGTDGSPAKFQRAMRDGMGVPIRDGLRRDVLAGLENVRREDCVAAAAAEFSAKPPETLRLVTIGNETNLYQARGVIAEPAKETQASQPASSTPQSAMPAQRASATHTERSSELTAGWQALANYKAEQALRMFDPAIKSADAAVAREARFGRAVALLDRQPVSPAQIEESRQLFTALADSGSDDAAQGARFFLGRIAQHHRQQPENAEAARQFRQLIAEYESSVWAQAALGRLALLQLYELDPAMPPAARVAEAEKLLAQAHTPAAQSDVHLALANAIFYFRLPVAGALPHLLAAEQLGRLDWTARSEVLIQIAELSRLGGERAQAAKFYREFLKENPRDLRHYIVKERIAEMDPPSSR